jgi:hypothetical protein
MADPRRPVSDQNEPREQRHESELEREERRLQRLRLVVTPWPTPNHYEKFEPGPQEAA